MLTNDERADLFEQAAAYLDAKAEEGLAEAMRDLEDNSRSVMTDIQIGGQVKAADQAMSAADRFRIRAISARTIADADTFNAKHPL